MAKAHGIAARYVDAMNRGERVCEARVEIARVGELAHEPLGQHVQDEYKGVEEDEVEAALDAVVNPEDAIADLAAVRATASAG